MKANGISRQFVYKRQKASFKEKVVEKEIVTKVLKVREQHRDMGARVMFHHLGIDKIGINKFENILSKNGLSVIRRKKRIVTTNGLYEQWDTNLINGLVLNDMNQVIAGDITYFILKDKTYYIFSLKDMYSKRIVGLYGSDTMLAVNAVKTLKQVIKIRKQNINGCIHHSDAGSQYKSNAYKKVLQKNEIKMSIGENCLQNGMAEQLNGVLKNSYLTTEIKSVNDLNKRLKEIKRLINYERPVAALDYKTPVQFEAWINEIVIKPKMKLYDFKKPK